MTLQLQPADGGAAVPASPSQIAGIRVDLGVDQVDNTPDAAKPISAAQAAVNTAQASTNSALASGVAANAAAVAGKADVAAFGGAPSILKLNQFVAAAQTFKVGHSVLIMGASTNARANNTYSVPDTTTYSRDGAGVVRVTTSIHPGATAGRYVKLGHWNDGRVDAICQVISATTIDSGTHTAWVLREVFTPAPRAAIALGSIHNNTGGIELHDLQSTSNTHWWLAKANQLNGGMLDITNFATGGTNPADWDPTMSGADRCAYLLNSGMRWDTVICDFGIGNAVTNPAATEFASTEALAASINRCLSVATQLGSNVIFAGVAGARFGGDDSLVANPGVTPDMTVLMRTHAWLRAYLADAWPSVEFDDVMSDYLSSSLAGSVTTSDMAAARSASELQDGDGIHYMPSGSSIVGRGPGMLLRKHTRGMSPFGFNAIDHVYANTAADLGGKYNPNGLVDWFGAVPTINVIATTNLSNVSIGTGIQGTTVGISGATANTVAAMSVVNSRRRGGREMQMLLTDPDGGLSLQLKYRGTDANTILAMVNDARFRGRDADAWLDFGFYGFEQNSVFSIDVSLVAVAGGVQQKVCSWLSNDGIQNMFGAQPSNPALKKAWCFGPNGPFRAGNGRIWLTPLTYTDAWIEFTVIGIAGVPMKQAMLRIGKKAFRVRDLLA